MNFASYSYPGQQILLKKKARKYLSSCEYLMRTYADALYRIKRGFLIIGLTGYTASGCSTARRILERESRPEFPGIETLGRRPDERRYNKLKRIWDELDWEKFVDIEASRVIFMLAIQRALRSNFRTGQLAELRRLALPHRTELDGIKYLTDERVDLKRNRVAEKLIQSYRRAKRLYGQFKTRCGYDVPTFIEVMQDFGDEIRKYGHVQPIRGRRPEPRNMFVLPEALRRLTKAYTTVEAASHFVIDAFRNPYEVEYFKRRYSEFYLVAIQRSIHARRQAMQGFEHDAIVRLETREKGGKVEERRKDNIHEWVTSQNIDECFQKADFFIENVDDTSMTWPRLRYHLIRVLSLVKNPGCVPPNRDERNMQLAMSARQNSGCLSRHVGAVVVNPDGYVLGVGWNDPPTGQVPCTLRTGKELLTDLNEKVFSEYERSSEFVGHIGANRSSDNPYCFKDEYSCLIGEKKAEFTRALHAEENALLQATRHGSEAVKEATLYTTDSPCTLCAKKAYQLGIKRIVFIEEYPGIAMDQTLRAGNRKTDLDQFEGTTSSAYLRVFSSLMKEKDMLTLYS
jgi:deoxycytidylate deaminase